MVTILAVEFLVVGTSQPGAVYLWSHPDASDAFVNGTIPFTSEKQTDLLEKRVLVFIGFCVLLVFEFIGMFGVLLMQHTQLIQLHVTDTIQQFANIRSKAIRKLIKAKCAILQREHLDDAQLY